MKPQEATPSGCFRKFDITRVAVPLDNLNLFIIVNGNVPAVNGKVWNFVLQFNASRNCFFKFRYAPNLKRKARIRMT